MLPTELSWQTRKDLEKRYLVVHKLHRTKGAVLKGAWESLLWRYARAERHTSLFAQAWTVVLIAASMSTQVPSSLAARFCIGVNQLVGLCMVTAWWFWSCMVLLHGVVGGAYNWYCCWPYNKSGRGWHICTCIITVHQSTFMYKDVKVLTSRRPFVGCSLGFFVGLQQRGNHLKRMPFSYFCLVRRANILAWTLIK